MQFQPRKILLVSWAILVLAIIGWWAWFFLSPSWAPGLVDIPMQEAPKASLDDIRTQHLNLIHNAIQSTLARWKTLPLPENSVKIRFGKEVLVSQGQAGAALFDAIGLNSLVDPGTGKSYAYAVSSDSKTYQIFAYLDDVQGWNYAVSDRVTFSVGTGKIFMQDAKGDIIAREWSGESSLDLSSNETRKKTGLEPLKSCQEIYTLLNTLTKPGSGVYIVDINGQDTKVFCDMQTDGGGWTLFYANNGHESSPIKKSYVEMRDTMKTEPVVDLSNFDDPNLAGLLDYAQFTALGAREVLIRNRAGDLKKWVKFSFSTSRALDWALGPWVLGKTSYGCIELPRNAFWDIRNDDKKINYEHLTQMMNHGGTSWGISHDKFNCNLLTGNVNPFLAFYAASFSDYSYRARSNYGIGGLWSGANEYRYFIR